MTPLSEQLQICVKVESLWVLGAIAAHPHPVVEVVVHMRACEIDRLVRGAAAPKYRGLTLETVSGPGGWVIMRPHDT